MLIHEPLMDQYKETMPWKCAFGKALNTLAAKAS